MSDADILEALMKIIEQRRAANPESSYVAQLFAGGTPLIARKVGEESIEALIASLAEDREKLVSEVADLWFHSLVLLANADADASDVLGELARRFGTSGHDEKAARDERVSG